MDSRFRCAVKLRFTTGKQASWLVGRITSFSVHIMTCPRGSKQVFFSSELKHYLTCVKGPLGSLGLLGSTSDAGRSHRHAQIVVSCRVPEISCFPATPSLKQVTAQWSVQWKPSLKQVTAQWSVQWKPSLKQVTAQQSVQWKPSLKQVTAQQSVQWKPSLKQVTAQQCQSVQWKPSLKWVTRIRAVY